MKGHNEMTTTTGTTDEAEPGLFPEPPRVTPSADSLLAEYLTSAQRHLLASRDTTAGGDRWPFLNHILITIAEQASAFWLTRLLAAAPAAAEAAAAEFGEMAEDGQDLAEWGWEQLAERGIDVDGIAPAEVWKVDDAAAEVSTLRTDLDKARREIDLLREQHVATRAEAQKLADTVIATLRGRGWTSTLIEAFANAVNAALDAQATAGIVVPPAVDQDTIRVAGIDPAKATDLAHLLAEYGLASADAINLKTAPATARHEALENLIRAYAGGQAATIADLARQLAEARTDGTAARDDLAYLAGQVTRLTEEATRTASALRTLIDPPSVVSGWLVWSCRHQMWWRANGAGYTGDPRRAGVYTETAAAEACRSASWESVDSPPDVAILAPTHADLGRADIDARLADLVAVAISDAIATVNRVVKAPVRDRPATVPQELLDATPAEARAVIQAAVFVGDQPVAVMIRSDD